MFGERTEAVTHYWSLWARKKKKKHKIKKLQEYFKWAFQGTGDSWSTIVVNFRQEKKRNLEIIMKQIGGKRL